ncbi:MAG: sigma-70 family RNA polymerase sigma factor [Prevotella sp.]|nr:sigma-70 family RNA polymerase sigma factor [Prevotella sp.]
MERKERDALVTGNMGYVVTIARQYHSELLTTDDLISEGAIGLMKAADHFDPSRGKPFVTFAAPYIRSSIEAAISKVQPTLQDGVEVGIRSTDESLPVGSNNNFTLLNVLENKDAPHADAHIEQDELAAQLANAADVLNEREHAVIVRLFGIGCDRMTMAEAGNELGLKRERVRQIRDKALRKMKKHPLS